MKSFWRIFKYVRPQWFRVLVVVVTAVLIGILFAASFATIVPLLKVMMGKEGLHGWVDRKVCDWRYGMEFYVPETTDFTDSDNTDIRYYLLITNVKTGGWADVAGIKSEDKIIGAGNALAGEGVDNIASSALLKELATCDSRRNITVQLTRRESRIEDRESRIEDRETSQVQLNTGIMPAYAKWAQEAVSFIPRETSKDNKQRAVVFIILVMAGVTIVRCVATFYQKYLAEKVVQVATAGLREDVFAHVMELPVGFLSSQGTTDTTSRLVTDITGVGSGVKILLGKALRESLKAIGTLTLAMMLSYKLTLIFITCAPAVIGLGVILGRKIKKSTKRSLASSALMLGRLEGAINALRVVKVYNRQKHEGSAYRQVNRRFLKQVLHIARVDAAALPIMEMLGMIAGSAALLVGVHWVINANMEAESFFALLVMLGATAESIRKSSDVWNKVQKANAAAERVFAVADESAESEKPGATELSRLKEKIEFRGVVFTYPGSNGPMLKCINLTVRAGHNVAIVGPNGSGKTTLMNLIPRFYNVDSGLILIDNQDIRDGTLRSLRNQIGMVTQNVVTFNDTIAANIGYGKTDVTLEEIVAAAKRSFAHEFIEPLPEGYATVIGEHGSGFSGGQLQRIVIARAILKNPPILIFDEATSQVDADSEAKIHKALSELMRNRTCFIIAHRFSTVMSADIIVVMNDGKIIAQGTHDELTRTCLLYQDLYETQLIIPQ